MHGDVLVRPTDRNDRYRLWIAPCGGALHRQAIWSSLNAEAGKGHVIGRVAPGG